MLLESEALIRLAVAAAIGLLIGFTRRRKAAGIRTFALICLGCAIFTIVSIRDDFTEGAADPSRIISQIVTGIGFLGLGVIWRSSKAGGRPVGLTTAATVWTTAAIGVLIGLGSWFIPHFIPADPKNPRDLRDIVDMMRQEILCQYMRYHGVYLPDLHTVFLSAVHTEEDADKIIDAFKASLVEMREDGHL